MTSSTPPQDLATLWKSVRHLYPTYLEIAREFVIEVEPCSGLEAGPDTPGAELVEEAGKWIGAMDQRIQVHQLRQFLQTTSLVKPDGLLHLLQHFLAKASKDSSDRDKIDFLLVQYFSQMAPARLDDNDVDLGYVAQSLEPVLGQVELKTPVWLNALDRVLDSARRCRSLDELLHGGVLTRGRKAKVQAGDLFFLPIALVAFTRFGYLMRRVFFHLMHGDLNAILDGVNELEEKGVATIDCRRAQFSAEEPISRLRMICQSWKVMFQAEYSSGQPLRMLVDLRASIDHVLGRSSTAGAGAKTSAPAKAVSSKGETPKPLSSAAGGRNLTAKATAGAAGAGATPASAPKSSHKSVAPETEHPEFEVSGAPDWDPDASQSGEKK